MWLSNLSIHRPVLATVMSLVLVLLGLVGFTRLSVREYPDIDPPVVSVTTLYAGASPEVIETTITEPLEDQITSIEGIKTLTSNSSEGMSNIIVTFELYRDIDLAAQDVRDRVARARQVLPDDVEEPVIVKQDADAQPIMWLGLASETYSQLQLTDYADRYIIDELQTIRGVGSVRIGGEREYAMRLWLNPQAMSARKVTPLNVRDALERNNIELPSGRIEGQEREFTIRTLGELKRPDEFDRLIIKTVNDIPVYFQDIGRAEIGAKSERSLVRMNGKTAVGLGIVKQSKANTLDVAHAIKDKLPELSQHLPKGMILKIGYDGSKSIEQSIDGVKDSLWQAVVMVTLVIFFFLGNARATWVPVVAIPVSLVATFFVMDLLDYSINTLTLLALTLAIGMVVDDAIVVLENIYRRLEEGEPPVEAAINGMQEIGFAVIATTLVLVAIFVPLTFMGGTVGRLFSEFAIALAGSVVISTFVALSLSPTMCAHVGLRPAQDSSPDSRQSAKASWSERITAPFRNLIDRSRVLYSSGLQWALARPIQIIAGSLVLLTVTGLAYVVIPKEFLPTEDNGFIMTAVRSPEGSSLAYTDKAVQKAEAVYAKHPDVDRYFSVVAFSQSGPGNVNEGIMFVTLNDKASGKRKKDQSEILQEITPTMMGIQEGLVFPFARPSSPTSTFGDPLRLVIQGFDLDTIAETSDLIKSRMDQTFGMYNVQNSLKLNKPQLKIDIKREKAAQLGISVKDISKTLQILMGGLNISTFQFNNKRYDVMVQAPDMLRTTPEALTRIDIKTDSGDMVPLTSVVNPRESVAPKELSHYDRQRSATLSAGIIPIPGNSLGAMMEKVETIAQEVLPPTMQYDWAGESLELIETQSTTTFALLLAVVVVFLVLAGQFESWSSPFIVILTVPLAICGAFITLFAFGSSFNTYSQIGMILLVGLATKNGILIVEYANQLRESHPHWGVMQVIQEACALRFRPIAMTAISTVMGAVPLIIGSGAGAEARRSLGLAIIGGMLFATFLTLFVLPVIYTLIHRDKSPTQV